jgi:hypothetical protein
MTIEVQESARLQAAATEIAQRLQAEIERLRAALQEAARRLIANGDGYGANEATSALEPKPAAARALDPPSSNDTKENPRR